MSNTSINPKRTLTATYWTYNPESGAFNQLPSIRFYSKVTDKRTLNDIAARYARAQGFIWDLIIITDWHNGEISRRYRRAFTIK